MTPEVIDLKEFKLKKYGEITVAFGVRVAGRCRLTVRDDRGTEISIVMRHDEMAEMAAMMLHTATEAFLKQGDRG